MSQTPTLPFSRQQVVDEAMGWVGTPYRLRGAVKGAAVDCGLLPYSVLRKFELIPVIPDEILNQLPDGWWVGAEIGDEKYLRILQKYLKKLFQDVRAYSDDPLEYALPGNLVVSKVSRSLVYNHAGIITRWPLVVHAAPPRADLINVTSSELWSGNDLCFFDIGLPA